jgi:hypothetical protein
MSAFHLLQSRHERLDGPPSRQETRETLSDLTDITTRTEPAVRTLRVMFGLALSPRFPAPPLPAAAKQDPSLDPLAPWSLAEAARDPLAPLHRVRLLFEVGQLEPARRALERLLAAAPASRDKSHRRDRAEAHLRLALLIALLDAPGSAGTRAAYEKHLALAAEMGADFEVFDAHMPLPWPAGARGAAYRPAMLELARTMAREDDDGGQALDVLFLARKLGEPIATIHADPVLRKIEGLESHDEADEDD